MILGAKRGKRSVASEETTGKIEVNCLKKKYSRERFLIRRLRLPVPRKVTWVSRPQGRKVPD